MSSLISKRQSSTDTFQKGFLTLQRIKDGPTKDIPLLKGFLRINRV